MIFTNVVGRCWRVSLGRCNDASRNAVSNMARALRRRLTVTIEDRKNDSERLHCGMDIVDTKNRGATQSARHHAGNRSGIPICRVGNSENVTDHRLSGNRKQDRASEAFELFQFSIDPEIIRFLLSEIDAGVEHDRFGRKTRSDRLANFLVEEVTECADDVVIPNVRLRRFGSPRECMIRRPTPYFAAITAFSSVGSALISLSRSPASRSVASATRGRQVLIDNKGGNSCSSSTGDSSGVTFGETVKERQNSSGFFVFI